MKIGFVFDLHMDYNLRPMWTYAKQHALSEVMNETDALVLGGDNTNLDPVYSNAKQFLSSLKEHSEIPIGFIVGNHDLYGPRFVVGETVSRLHTRLEQFSILANWYDLIHLENQNMVVGDVTIGGTYGHYDGTLAGQRFETDYDCVSNLTKNLEKRMDVKGRKILVTHTIPTAEMTGRMGNEGQEKADKYAGSVQLADVIRRMKPEVHFCGHSHAYAESKIRETRSFNLGTDYKDFFYFVFDTSTGSVERKQKKLVLANLI